jgi:ribonuclease G
VPTEILISSDPWENRVAVLEDGELAELYFEREEKVIGSIYKGKVMNVLPGMGASFVDIGLGRNAFLYVDDINKTPLNIGDVEITSGRTGWTITEKVERGDDVLVQIVKEPRGLKGARISTNISLPGRYLILMPTGKYSGVSRKIESAEERNRLKGIMKLIRPDGMATVVRTAAANVSQAELIADLGVLIRMWHGILESYKRAPAPSLIHKDMNLVYKAARDFITPEVDKVYIDDAEEYEKVRDFMRLLGPQYVDRIVHYTNGKALFKDFKIDAEVMKLLRPKVNLPSGGSIVIETTEALTVIDVNSGKFTGGRNLEDTIVKTNIEAAAEIARQVRLRDIGGIIVCDFIDMSSEASRNRVIATLEAGLRKDRTRSTIQSFSALGLLEFTRKRVGKDLAGQLRGHCPTCSGLGTVMSPETVAIDAFRDLRRVGHEHRNGSAGKPLEVISAPTVGAQLEYWYEDELASLEKELGSKIAVRVDASMHPEKTRVVTLGSDAEATAPPSNVRVGDEFEVELVHARLPVSTSALAIIENRLVEVEGAANAIGQTVKIKVIDIDDEGTILAEPRSIVAAGTAAIAGEGKRRRRRGGRGRKKVELTPQEQEEQLRELAEEAAKGLGGRPVLGISTTAEAEAEDAEAREAVVPTGPPLATVTPLRPVPEYAATTPGEERVYASYGGTATDGEVRKRRRRRRRRRGGAPGEAGAPLTSVPFVPNGVPADAAGADAEGEFEDDDADEAATPAAGTAAQPGAPAAVEGDGTVRRRRRRRRRRGRGGQGEGDNAATGTAGAVPDRSIFRAGSAGVEATGQTAPPEPGRAIARRDERPRPVAVDAPPRSLSVPDDAPKVAKPSRGRRARTAASEAAGELVVNVHPALPPPADSAAASAAEVSAAPKRRGRPPKVAAASEVALPLDLPVAEPAKRPGRKPKAVAEAAPDVVVSAEAPAPKRRGRPPKVAVAAAEEPAPKATATRKKSATTAAAPAAKKATKAPAARATTAKKSSTSAKASPAKKTSTRKKTS